MTNRIPKWMEPLVFWLYALWVRFDAFKPWMMPRIARSIRAAESARRRRRQRDLIVFVCDGPDTRMCKLSYALREKGWKVILLHRHPSLFDLDPYFDEAVRCVDRWEALEQASRYTPVAFHVFSLANFRIASTLIAHRPGKIVFDNTDQLSGISRPVLCAKYPGQVAMERYCLENADGLRCRDMTSQYAKRKMGYRIRGRRIFFPDFGWGLPSRRTPPRRQPYSVAFCGSMTVEKENPHLKYTNFLGMFRALSAQGVHVHMYPNLLLSAMGIRDRFNEYFDLEKMSPYFHIHASVPPEKLAEELSQYTFAVYGWGAPIHLGHDDVHNYRQAADYALGSRYSDYVEAGLILLSEDGRLPLFLTRHYRLGVLATDSIFPSARKWMDEVLKSLGGRCESNRDRWVMPRQIHRLEAFYRSL